jgi:hypothetical protein
MMRKQRVLYFEDDAQIAQRLEEIFAEHPRKTLPPDLLRDIEDLKEGKRKRVQVIEHAMDMVHEDQNHAREETLLALDLLIEYVLAIEYENFLTINGAPLSLLSKLSEAMFELGRGIVDPALRPDKPHNRPPDSHFLRAQKIMAAAACEALIQLNEGRDKSASEIARLLNKIGFSPNGRPATATAVLYWRQKFHDELTFEIDRDIFKAMAWSDGHSPQLAIDKKQVLKALGDLMTNEHRFPRWVDWAFFMKDGKLYQRWQGQGFEKSFSTDDHDRVQRLVQIRNIVNDLLSAQLAGDKTATAVRRQKLNAAWKAFVKKHGPINRIETTTTSRLNKAGEPVVIERRPNFDRFRSDPDAFKVSAIEEYDRQTDKAKPAAIQTEDVIGPYCAGTKS